MVIYPKHGNVQVLDAINTYIHNKLETGQKQSMPHPNITCT